MSKPARRSSSATAPSSASSDDATEGGRLVPQFKPPLRPSRKRLIVAAALLFVWLGLLLTLYVTAVFPEKQKRQSTSPPEVTPPAGTVAR